MLVFSLAIATVLTLGYMLLFERYRLGWVSLKVDSAPDAFRWTIIIPFRNESGNLLRMASAIKELEGIEAEEVEVMWVDDGSSDKGEELILQVLSGSGIRFQVLQAESSGKKQAIKQAVKVAKGDYILTLDADAFPSSKWLIAFRSFIGAHDYHLVAGPVRLGPASNGFEKWQQLEFAGLIGVTGGAIASGNPSMCNGANLCFRREAYLEIMDELDAVNSPSGDDQFLMHALAIKHGVSCIGFLKSADALVETAPLNSVKDFIRQRARWISKAGLYQRVWVTLELLFVFLFTIQIPVYLLLGFQGSEFIWLAVSVLLVKFLIEYRFYAAILPFFKLAHLKSIIWWAEAFQVIYICSIGIIGKVLPIKWKGRRYHGNRPL